VARPGEAVGCKTVICQNAVSSLCTSRRLFGRLPAPEWQVGLETATPLKTEGVSRYTFDKLWLPINVQRQEGEQ
jgi:hypothetical protein